MLFLFWQNEAHLRRMKNEVAYGYEACLRHINNEKCASLHGNEVATSYKPQACASYSRSECFIFDSEVFRNFVDAFRAFWVCRQIRID